MYDMYKRRLNSLYKICSCIIGGNMISRASFGVTRDGEETFLYTLTSGEGMAIQVTNYGGSLYSVLLQDKEGNVRDIVLGCKDIAHRVWEEKNLTENSVTFKSCILDEEQKGLNTMEIELSYIVIGQKICIVYSAKAEKKVFLNVKNHSFFNLNGRESCDVLDHKIWINADECEEFKKDNRIPIGKIMTVENTPNHFWVLKNNSNFDKVALLHSEKSGITMEVYTDMPAIKVYTGNCFENEQEKRGVCIETLFSSDVENVDVEEGKRFCSATVYKFIV